MNQYLMDIIYYIYNELYLWIKKVLLNIKKVKYIKYTENKKILKIERTKLI